MQKPLIILPCSQEKLSEPAVALKLYQGKGYFPLLSKTTASLGMDYDLAILSAKYGLIDAYETIEPYELKLSRETLPAFVKQQSRKANALIKNKAPSEIIACLPKLYLEALTLMLNEDNALIPMTTPPAGAGIGSQRGFLASALKAIEPRYLDVFFFGKEESGKTSKSAIVRIRPGTEFFPWLKNDEENGYRPVHGKLVTAEKFINDGSVQRIIDTNGNAWCTSNFKFGLSAEIKTFISSYILEYVDVCDEGYSVFEFSELQSAFNEYQYGIVA